MTISPAPVQMAVKEAVQGVVCPTCLQPVTWNAGWLTCTACGASYPLEGTVPIMLPRRHEAVLQPAPRPRFISWLKVRVQNLPHPSLKYSTATRRNIDELRARLAPSARVLVVGAGVHHGGNQIERLGPDILANTVNLDIEAGRHTDIAADAHRLPFPEGHFDCVLSQGVLEHTRDSDRAAAEMFRVLKPGGLVYAEAPFLQPGHMEHSDFRRFTRQGLETLFSRFDKMHSGVNGSAASTMCWLTAQSVAAALCFGSDAVYWFLKLVLWFVVLPFKYLDILWRLPQARLLASGHYFLGRKPLECR